MRTRLFGATRRALSTYGFAPASLVAMLLLAPCTASAYVDPNTGGLLFQLLAPLFAAIAGCWLFLRRWIADLFRRLWRLVTGRTDE
jgi:hypothetical protein